MRCTWPARQQPRLFRFNPATPNVAPVPSAPACGATVPSSLRMAFSPTGTLYYLPDTRLLYTINTTTGVATSTGVTIGNSNITSGGDMAFNSAGTLYILHQLENPMTANIGSGAVTQVGNAPVTSSSPSANATIGLSFNAAGELLAQTQNPNNIYRIPLPVGSTSTPTGVLVTGATAALARRATWRALTCLRLISQSPKPTASQLSTAVAQSPTPSSSRTAELIRSREPLPTQYLRRLLVRRGLALHLRVRRARRPLDPATSTRARRWKLEARQPIPSQAPSPLQPAVLSQTPLPFFARLAD